MVGKSFMAVDFTCLLLIVIGFQLIIKGRAKIILGVDFFS